MRLIGLTGGIGSGKSTVSSLLEALGYEVIDADAITRALQAPGQPTLAAIVDEFGDDILLGDGQLNRARLAERVFSDREKLEQLNAIVHPAVGAEIGRRLDALAARDIVVFLDIPLLVESGRDDLELTVVVDTDPETAIRRLVENRGFTASEARARIANQVSREDRLARADIVLDNNGPLGDLERQVTDLVRHLTSPRK